MTGPGTPRYFFHTDLGEDLLTDSKGIELRDADHAWAVARATVEALLGVGQDQARLMAANLVAADEAGEIVFEFPFVEVVTSPSTASATLH